MGPSSWAAAVATMRTSSTSSAQAIITMSGSVAMQPRARAPAWVGPSAPASPALSMQNRTGSFCKATS